MGSETGIYSWLNGKMFSLSVIFQMFCRFEAAAAYGFTFCEH